jgi:hypothetical protein
LDFYDMARNCEMSVMADFRPPEANRGVDLHIEEC